MADVSIDIELVTKAFNNALKESGEKVKGFQLQVQRTEKGVTTSFRKIDKEAKKTSSAFNVLGGAVSSFVGNLAANAVASFVSSIRDLGAGIVDGALRFEQLSVQFEVLTGNATIARDVLQDITEFAAQTPFQLEDISTAAAQLLAFGTAAEDVRGQLQRIGDVSAAVNQPIERLSFIFGQIQSQGRLTAERLNQLQDAAVPIAPALAKSLGIAETELRDFVSNTGVSFEQFQEAFNSLSDAGGPAFEGLIRQSKTLGGLISNLTDTFTLLQVEIGNELLPFLKELGTTFLGLIQNNRDFIITLATDALRGFANVATVATSALNIFLAVIDAADIAVNSLFVAFEQAKIAALTVGEAVINLAIALRELAGLEPSETLDRASQSLRTLKEQSKITRDEVISDIKDTIAEREKEGEALGKFADKLQSTFNKEKDLESQRAQDAKIRTEAAKARREQEAAEQRAALVAQEEALKEIRNQFAEEEKIIRLEAEIVNEENTEIAIQKTRDVELQKIEIKRQAAVAEAALIQDSFKKEQAIEAANEKARLASLKVNLKTDTDLRKNAADKKKKIQEGSVLASQQFLQAGIQLAKQGSREQKALSIANATISTYTAATRAYQDYPFPANVAVMASTIALGLAQVSKIQSAGNFQDGGIVPGSSFSGDQLTANVNSGELILNRGQQQRLLNIANGQESGNSVSLNPEDIRQIVESTVAGMQVVLVADDTEIARSASRGADNGVVIGGN